MTTFTISHFWVNMGVNLLFFLRDEIKISLFVPRQIQWDVKQTWKKLWLSIIIYQKKVQTTLVTRYNTRKQWKFYKINYKTIKVYLLCVILSKSIMRNGLKIPYLPLSFLLKKHLSPYISMWRTWEIYKNYLPKINIQNPRTKISWGIAPKIHKIKWDANKMEL